jgi:hypothetical protein
LVSQLLDLQAQLQRAAADGKLEPGVALVFKDIQINGKSVQESSLMTQLENAEKASVSALCTTRA